MNEPQMKEYQRGLALKERGAYQLARYLFRKLLAYSPESSMFLIALADCYALESDIDRALKIYSRVVANDVTNVDASLGLFQCYWKQGDMYEAAAEIRRFLASSCSEAHLVVAAQLTYLGTTLKDTNINELVSQSKKQEFPLPLRKLLSDEPYTIREVPRTSTVIPLFASSNNS